MKKIIFIAFIVFISSCSINKESNIDYINNEKIEESNDKELSDDELDELIDNLFSDNF